MSAAPSAHGAEILPTPTSSAVIFVVPAEAYPGDTIQVTGGYWPAGSEVTLFLDENDPKNGVPSIGQTTADPNGGLDTTFVVPSDRAGGSYNFLGCAAGCSPIDSYTSATRAFAILPVISVDPTRGAPGDENAVNGAGAPAETTVDIYFDYCDLDSGVPALATATSDSNGVLSTSFVVPDDRQEGDYVVTACQGCSSDEPVLDVGTSPLHGIPSRNP